MLLGPVFARIMLNTTRDGREQVQFGNVRFNIVAAFCELPHGCAANTGVVVPEST